jgi:hypothetical protein
MSKTTKIIGKSLKAIFYLIIVVINVIILWRVLFSGDPSSIKPILANEQTVAAYEEQGNELKLYVQKQKVLTDSGRFAVTDCVFIPEANQIQVTVRYNNSTLRYLAEDYELSEIPDRKTEIFDVTIVKTTDLTPDNPDDNLDENALMEERFYPSEEPKTAYKSLYSYRKFIFDNITWDDAVGLFVDIYYNDDIEYSEKPYDVLCIYDALMEMEERSLSGADKRVLKKAVRD